MHPECVEEKARVLMSRLGPTLGMHGAVLASGTGLALHLGHRTSGDLEFFTRQSFRPNDILDELSALTGSVELVVTGPGRMTLMADDALVSLEEEPVRFVEPTTRVNGCDVAGVTDIAAMKLLAVQHDGSRSDFIDLYAALERMPFRRVARNAVERYGASAVEPLNVGRGLVWFGQADAQADPVGNKPAVTWDDVKDYFRSSLRQFVYDVQAETAVRISEGS